MRLQMKNAFMWIQHLINDVVLAYLENYNNWVLWSRWFKFAHNNKNKAIEQQQQQQKPISKVDHKLNKSSWSHVEFHIGTNSGNEQRGITWARCHGFEFDKFPNSLAIPPKKSFLQMSLKWRSSSSAQNYTHQSISHLYAFSTS